MPELTPPKSSPTADAALLLEVAELVVSALNLDVGAADVQADEPLYGDGLGLDSIDILEIALVFPSATACNCAQARKTTMPSSCRCAA